MTIDKWIALGSLITSFFSAFAAFLAIRQTIIQRLTAIKPQIIIKETTIKAEDIKVSTPLPMILGSKKNIPISVVNIGLGAALNFRYQWEYDYDKSLQNLNFQAGEDYQKNEEIKKLINSEEYAYNKDSNNEYTFIHITGHGTSNYYSHKNKPYEIEYVLPHTIDKEGNQLYIPELIILLKTNETLNKAFNFTEIFTPIKGPTLNISFEDISGNMKKESFNSFFNLKSIGLRDDQFDYEIIVNFKRAERWTQRGLQWIRDGYAEWMQSFN